MNPPWGQPAANAGPRRGGTAGPPRPELGRLQGRAAVPLVPVPAVLRARRPAMASAFDVPQKEAP